MSQNSVIAENITPTSTTVVTPNVAFDASKIKATVPAYMTRAVDRSTISTPSNTYFTIVVLPLTIIGLILALMFAIIGFKFLVLMVQLLWAYLRSMFVSKNTSELQSSAPKVHQRIIDRNTAEVKERLASSGEKYMYIGRIKKPQKLFNKGDVVVGVIYDGQG